MVSETLRCDVVILGGGPAGSAAALSLRQHAPSLSVALVERTNYGTTRIGETLSPAVRPLLSHLGVYDEFRQQAHVTSFGTRSTWGTPGAIDNESVFSARGEGWHLDRRRFDLLLSVAARKREVDVFTNSQVDSVGKNGTGQWLLQVRRDDGTQCSIRAKFVVDATGRRAWFARKYGGAMPILFDRLIAAFVFFQNPLTSTTRDSLTRVESGELHWWYAAAIPDTQVAVACMTDSDIAARLRLKEPLAWSQLLHSTADIAGFLGTAVPLGPPRLHPAHSRLLDKTVGEDWLAVGDAASTWDPLSSLGIVKALRSGTFAAYAIADHLQGDNDALVKYRRYVKAEFDGYLRTRAFFYGAEQRWPDSPFWNRRRTATPDGISHAGFHGLAFPIGAAVY